MTMRKSQEIDHLRKAYLAQGKHLFWLGVLLLVVIVAGMSVPVVIVLYVTKHSLEWPVLAGIAFGAASGVAIMLVAVSKVLNSVARVIEARNRPLDRRDSLTTDTESVDGANDTKTFSEIFDQISISSSGDTSRLERNGDAPQIATTPSGTVHER